MTIGGGGSGGYAYVVPEPTPEQHRARARAEYVRAHAPTIFAGLCADKAKWSTWDVQITVAVEIAGLLFDETESSGRPDVGGRMTPRKLYPGAVVAFWGPKWSHLPERALEPAIVVRVFDNGTFSCVGVDESGTLSRAHAKIADYSSEPKSYHWCWPEEVADG